MLYSINSIMFCIFLSISILLMSVYIDSGIKYIKESKVFVYISIICFIFSLTIFSINRIFVETDKIIIDNIKVVKTYDNRDNEYYLVDLDNGTTIILIGCDRKTEIISQEVSQSSEDTLVIEVTKPKIKILNYDKYNLMTYKLYTKNK